jgi:hypothetical protein
MQKSTFASCFGFDLDAMRSPFSVDRTQPRLRPSKRKKWLPSDYSHGPFSYVLSFADLEFWPFWLGGCALVSEGRW